MTIRLYILFLCLFFYSCLDLKEKLTYNPFDYEYNVSIDDLLKDSCKLLYQPCGYGTYGKEIEGNIIYYQFYPKENDEACAKGISIHLDTFEIETKIKESSLIRLVAIEKIGRELLFEKIDTPKILSFLSEFGLKRVPVAESEMEFIDYEIFPRDTIRKFPPNNTWCFKDKTGRIHTTNVDFKTSNDKNNNTTIIRTLDFFVDKPEIKQKQTISDQN